MKIQFLIGDMSIPTTLEDRGATRDFASLLPLDLELKDLFAREKSGQLPRRLSEEGRRTYAYEVGDAVYWPSGPLVAVFYRQDNRALPPPGTILLRAIDADVETFAGSSPIHATIERAD